MTGKLTFCTRAAAVALLTAANAAAAADADPAVVETVTVTATKRTTELEKTPIAITALSNTTLDEAHVNNVEDLTHLVPSFAGTQQGDHDVITLTLRGIGNDNAKTEQADPEVAIYVNGIYSPRAEGATTLLYDLDGIEVLRGPQGTLWGRNATVGAVNMVTAKPVLGDFFGNIELGGGDYNAFETRGVLNLPVNDRLAFRAAFADGQHDGYVNYQAPPNIPGINKDLFVTSSSAAKYNGQDERSERLSMLFEPLDNVTWNLSYENFSDKSTPSLFLLEHPRPGEQLYSALIDTAPFTDRGSNSLRSRIDWDINDYLSVSYIAGFQWLHGAENYDQDGGAIPPTSANTPAGNDQEDRTTSSNYYNYSHEIDLKSSGTHTVDWLTGLYYAHENNNIRFDINQFNGTTEGGAGGFNGSFIQPLEVVESAAIFGQSTWNVTDALHVTGGLRYTHDDKRNDGGFGVACFGTQPNTNLPCPSIDASSNPAKLPGYVLLTNFNPQKGTNSTSNSGFGQWERLTWLARADYDFTPDLLGYASIGTGYKSGGLIDGGGRFGPENLTSYEIGTKAKLFDGSVTLNNSAYYEDFKGYQFSQPLNVFGPNGQIVGTSLFTTNAQGATVYGLESELAARITPDDRVSLQVALEQTDLGNLFTVNTYVSAANQIVNLKGNELAHSPAFSGTVSYEHHFQLANGAEIIPQVTSHFETSSFLSVFNFGANDRQDAYTRTDLNLTYQSNSSRLWSLEAFVRNLENGQIKTLAETYTNGVAVSNGVFVNPPFLAQYLPPRTFGLRLKVWF